MVKQINLERMWQHIRSREGFVTVELAIGIATLTFGFLIAVATLGVFLVQLNLIDTAHNAARMAARGQSFEFPANIDGVEQLQNGVLVITVRRSVDFWFKRIELTANSKVVIE
jgi:hypothetical protein